MEPLQSANWSLLKPPSPTPPDEICACEGNKPVKLMSALGYNPIHCIDCNLEVDPESLSLSADLIGAIAHWHNIYDAINRLWLGSGDNEDWAKADVSTGLDMTGWEFVRSLYYVEPRNRASDCA